MSKTREVHKTVRQHTVINLIIFLGLFLLFSVLAEASAVVVTPVDNEITLSEEAVFQVAVVNDGETSLSYTLYGLEVVWSVAPEARQFTLRPGQSRPVIVRIRPLGPFKPSTYGIKLFVDESTGSGSVPRYRFEEEMSIILYPDEPQEYLPAVIMTADIPAEINPQQPVPLSVHLVNRNPLNLTSLRVSLQSEMAEFNQEQATGLSPREDKTVSFTVTPNRHQAPREYTVFVVLERLGQPLKVLEKKVAVITSRLPFLAEVTASKSWFKTNTQVQVTNDGNVPDTQEVQIPFSLGSALMTSGNDRLEREQGQTFLVSEVSLEPGESTTLVYVTNYRLPLYLLIAAILLGLFYLYARSPVQLKKSAVTTKAGDDGTLSEVKITLEVRNLSRKPLREIVLTDLVPSIANLEKGFEMGTIKPMEVKHTTKGTKVLWSIAELDPQEHRIITYKIKAKLHILGTFSLPRASLEYNTVRGRKRKAYSGVYRLG